MSLMRLDYKISCNYKINISNYHFIIFMFFCETALKMQEIVFENLKKPKNISVANAPCILYRWVVPPIISWFIAAT